MDTQKMVNAARASYPNAKSDLEALALRVSALEGHQAERIAVLNLNAAQAQKIALLLQRIAELERATLVPA